MMLTCSVPFDTVAPVNFGKRSILANHPEFQTNQQPLCSPAARWGSTCAEGQAEASAFGQVRRVGRCGVADGKAVRCEQRRQRGGSGRSERGCKDCQRLWLLEGRLPAQLPPPWRAFERASRRAVDGQTEQQIFPSLLGLHALKRKTHRLQGCAGHLRGQGAQSGARERLLERRERDQARSQAGGHVDKQARAVERRVAKQAARDVGHELEALGPLRPFLVLHALVRVRQELQSTGL